MPECQSLQDLCRWVTALIPSPHLTLLGTTSFILNIVGVAHPRLPGATGCSAAHFGHAQTDGMLCWTLSCPYAGTAAFFQPAPAPGPAPGPAPSAAIGAPMAAPAGAGAPSAGALPAALGPAPLPATQPELQLAAVPAGQFAAIAAALHLSAQSASAAATALAASASVQEAAASQLDALLATAAAVPISECGLAAVPPNLMSALTGGPLGSLQGPNVSDSLSAAAAALAGLPADLLVVPAPPSGQLPTAPAPGPQPASTAPAPGPASSFPAAVLAPDNAPHPQGAPAVPTLQQIADKYAAAGKP